MYKDKYLKYKTKYLELKNNYMYNMEGGGNKKLNKKLNKRLNKIYKNKNYNNNNNNNMDKVTTYKEHLSEPWFTLISLGKKTVEGRKNKGKFKDMNVDDIIIWFNDDFKHREVKTRITRKAIYKTFEEYLTTEGLDKCLPGMGNYSIEHGLSVYFQYFTKEQEKEFGVVAIELQVLEHM